MWIKSLEHNGQSVRDEWTELRVELAAYQMDCERKENNLTRLRKLNTADLLRENEVPQKNKATGGKSHSRRSGPYNDELSCATLAISWAEPPPSPRFFRF